MSTGVFYIPGTSGGGRYRPASIVWTHDRDETLIELIGEHDLSFRTVARIMGLNHDQVSSRWTRIVHDKRYRHCPAGWECAQWQ